MTIHLAPEDEALVARMLTTGQFPNTADVIHEALIALEEREKIRRLRALVDEADADIERGNFVEWGPELMGQIRISAQTMVRSGRAIDPDVCP
jgi:putative addiction module CopG family antidote